MKFKVGDKVKVRSLEDLKSNYRVDRDGIYGPYNCVSSDMQKLCDRVVTIQQIKMGHYNLSEDKRSYSWYDWMFEDKKVMIHSEFVLAEGDILRFCYPRLSISLASEVFICYGGESHFLGDKGDSSKGSKIFELLVKDKEEFCCDVIGYCGSGDFPYCKSLEDLTTLVLALAEEAQKQGMEVKFERKS
jgi:hypothetical protein